MREGVGHGQDAWAAQCAKFDGCSREALRATHLEKETAKIRLDEDPDDFLYRKGPCHDRLDSVTSKESLTNHQCKDIILQCFSPEYGKSRQIQFKSEDCNLGDIRRIYAAKPWPLQFRLVKRYYGTWRRMQATGWDLSNTKFHYCNKFGHYKNNCADFKAACQQNHRRRQQQHKQRGGHQPHQSKPRGKQQQRGGENVVLIPQDQHPQRHRLPRQGRQTGPMEKPTSPNSVLRVFLGSASCGVFLWETAPTRTPACPRRERSSLQSSPSKSKWRRRRGLGHSTQPRQQRRRGGALVLGHLLCVLSRPFPLEDRVTKKK